MKPFLHIRYIDTPPKLINGQSEANSGIVDNTTNCGSFPTAFWKLNNTFEAEVDPHGLFQLFYYYDEENFYISFSLIDIAQIIPNPQLDFDALSVFYRIGSFVENDTPIIGVKVLGPSGKLTIKNGLIKTTEHHHWSTKSIIGDQQKHRSIYRSLFSKSIDGITQHWREGVTIPLSGGRDSRHVFIEALKQDVPIDQVASSYYEPTNLSGKDVGIAKQIAHKAGLDLKVIKVSNNWLKRELFKNDQSSFLTMLHGWYVDLASQFPDNSLVLDGLAGDVLSESKVMNPEVDQAFKDMNWEWLIEYYLGRDDAAMTVFSSVFKEKLSRSRARKRLLPVLKRFSAYNNPQSAFRFYSRTRRNIAQGPISLRGSGKVAFPFLDKELFQYLTAVPTSAFPDNNFHTSAIFETYPEFSNIPFSGIYDAPRYSIANRIKYKYSQNIHLSRILTKHIFNNPFSMVDTLPKLMFSLLFPLSNKYEEWLGPRLAHMHGLVLLQNGIKKSKPTTSTNLSLKEKT